MSHREWTGGRVTIRLASEVVQIQQQRVGPSP
jgi:hypothetical protein